MRNRLQYVYSIAVFGGVLIASYLMMDRDGNAKIPFRFYQGPYYRADAVIVDPALHQLFEVESALKRQPEVKKDKDLSPPLREESSQR